MSGFIERGTASRIPKDSVRITREEAVERQWKLVYEWKPSSDVWPFRYGLGALTLSTGVSSILITNHYRRKLKLLHYGRFGMYFPTVLLPSFLATIAHVKLVSEEVLLQSECPICIQVRSIVTQSILGFAYPLILSPLAAFGFSTVFGTYRLPLFSLKNVPELYGIFRKFTEPFKSRLIMLLAIQVGVTVAVTNAEAQSLFKIYRKLKEQDLEELPQ